MDHWLVHARLPPAAAAHQRAPMEIYRPVPQCLLFPIEPMRAAFFLLSDMCCKNPSATSRSLKWLASEAVEKIETQRPHFFHASARAHFLKVCRHARH